VTGGGGTNIEEKQRGIDIEKETEGNMNGKTMVINMNMNKYMHKKNE
jgi:hypothetical protein